MRKALIMLIATFGVFAWAGPASAVGRPQPKSPRRVVRAYVDDVNRGDAAAAASQFSHDAELVTHLGSCTPCTGREVIQEKLAGAVGVQTHIAYTRLRVSKDEVTAASSLTSSNFPPGVTRAIGTFTATVRKGKLVRLVQEYDRSDPETAALLAAVGG